MAVEALVDEELTPGRGTVSVEVLVARHLQLGAEVPAGVRIDEQERVPAGGEAGRDGDPVRSLPLDPWRRTKGDLLTRIEGLEVGGVDPLDVAADAAFGEAERHPRLEMLQHLGMYLRVGREEVVEAVCPSIHQRLHLRWALRVIGLKLRLADVEPGAQVLPDRLFAVGLRRAAERGQV